MINRHLTRRGFLRMGSQALASGTLLSTLGTMERALAASDTSGYRALVCVFLFGGNDSFNWLVPSDTAGYGTYAATRQTLALPKASLLPITPTNISAPATYGLHPNSDGIRTLFESGKAAFVANVGTLIRPVTRTQYRNGTATLPPYLFSHSDQQSQWQTSYPQSNAGRGWAGRIADLLASESYNPQLSVNVSLAGNNIWQSGGVTVPYALGLGGAQEFDAVAADYYEEGRRRDAFLALRNLADSDASPLVTQYAKTTSRAIDLASVINSGLAAQPALATAFPTTYVGAQLKMAARMIQARNVIGVSRQLFFVGIGGYDTHDTQLDDQAKLLGELSAGLLAFQTAMGEIAAESLVTTFTASDFGRTLTSNGDGSDHGWGGHALVMGGAVSGRKIYGAMPSLAIDGPDDAEEGRIIPTTATDQYAATLARWFGVASSDLPTLFPNLSNFASSNLGFLP